MVRELGILAGILPDLTETARSGITLLRSWLMDMTDRTPQSVRPLLQQNVAGLFSGGTALLDKGFSWLLGLAEHAPQSLQPLLAQKITDLFSGGTALLDRAIHNMGIHCCPPKKEE